MLYYPIMKTYTLFCFLLVILFASCKEEHVNVKNPIFLWDSVTAQYEYLYQNVFSFKDSETPMPRTLVEGKLHTVGIYDCTSGFHSKDKVPYWDYDALVNEETSKDVSAAAIVASALYELRTFVAGALKDDDLSVANTVLETLSSTTYSAKVVTNEGFLLKHSNGHLPANSEIDVPINYADYYFLEALLRKKSDLKVIF